LIRAWLAFVIAIQNVIGFIANAQIAQLHIERCRHGRCAGSLVEPLISSLLVHSINLPLPLRAITSKIPASLSFPTA
jgi:hypothetical protein